MKKQFSLFIATAGYLGLIPGAPGTYASVMTVVLYYIVFRAIGSIGADFHLGLVALVSLIGIVTAAETSRQCGISDPSHVVIDEVAGQLLTFLFLPVTIPNAIAGLVLFRIFDIWKPSPVRQCERFGGGIGIMADDLMAGIYANVILQIVHVGMLYF